MKLAHYVCQLNTFPLLKTETLTLMPLKNSLKKCYKAGHFSPVMSLIIHLQQISILGMQKKREERPAFPRGLLLPNVLVS